MLRVGTNDNFGGRQANNTAFIKQFNVGFNNLVTWIYTNSLESTNVKTITPADSNANVLILKDLNVVGSVNSASDKNLKNNILDFDNSFSEKIMDLFPKKYNYIDQPLKTRYGLIAQDVQKIYPDLVNEIKIDKNIILSINYIDIIPLLLHKIQQMQKEIDELKNKL